MDLTESGTVVIGVKEVETIQWKNQHYTWSVLLVSARSGSWKYCQNLIRKCHSKEKTALSAHLHMRSLHLIKYMEDKYDFKKRAEVMQLKGEVSEEGNI